MRIFQQFLLAGALAASPLVSEAAGQTRFATLDTLSGTNPIGLTSQGGLLNGVAAHAGLNGDCGTFFQLQPPASPGAPWTQATILTLDSSGSGGCTPFAAPIPGPLGTLYGTAQYGGTYNSGVFYELQPPSTPSGAWTENVLYNFDIYGTGTGYPAAPIPGPNGSFYCSAAGGVDAFGALVQLQPPSAPGGTWTQTVLYNFADFPSPNTLVPGPGGVLYGTSWWGQVMQFSPPAMSGGAWTATVLYTLTGNDGLGPTSLVRASDGTLYGTAFGTNYGQGNGKATVFQLTPPKSSGGGWSFKVLQDFGVNLNLNSPLILRNGNLYGTVASGSGMGGQVFELQPPATSGGAWTLVHLHQFTGNQLPGGTLVMDKNGDIFGVTAAAYNVAPSGTVYRLATK